MQFAEIVSELGEYAIYQDVSVQPGEHLSWSLKHAPRGYTGQRDADQMQVLIGPPGHETVSPATRLTSNGTGKVGETSDTITTYANANRDFHPWETYTGTYLVPDGVTKVRFTFKGLTKSSATHDKFVRSGNLIDDVSFQNPPTRLPTTVTGTPTATHHNGNSGMPLQVSLLWLATAFSDGKNWVRYTMRSIV